MGSLSSSQLDLGGLDATFTNVAGSQRVSQTHNIFQWKDPSDPC